MSQPHPLDRPRAPKDWVSRARAWSKRSGAAPSRCGNAVRRIAPPKLVSPPRAMAMASLRATLGQPPSPCPCTSWHHCVAFPLPQQPGVAAYPRIEATARHGERKENAKVRNRRRQRKFNGTAEKPRLSVFCSNRQLYAMLVDDHGKRILFYGSTLQESICGDPPCSTVEAARRVGEELVRACKELEVSEISAYDRNGFARGEKMMAFEGPVALHGFLPR